MNSIIQIILWFFIFTCSTSHAETTTASRHNTIDTFYSDVDSQSQSPPSEEALRSICQKKRKKGGYINFIGIEDKKVFLFALTKNKIRHADKSIYLETKFFKSKGALPRASGRGPGVTPDWGYVFDRNQDGYVDYFAYMYGPMPVPPPAYDGSLPVLPGKITRENGIFFIENTPLTFWHTADDNYDGQTDALALRSIASDTGWSDGWMVIQGIEEAKKLENCNFYSNRMPTKPQPCKRIDNEYTYITNEGSKATLPARSPFWLLPLINDSAKECRFDSSNFYALPNTYTVEKQKINGTDSSENEFLE